MTDEQGDGEFAGVDWATVYERQAARGGLVSRFVSLLRLAPGASVVDLGAGPGYTAGKLADVVAPGHVYALDRSAGALAYLGERLTPADGTVVPICGDLRALPLCLGEPTPLLAAFLLHHVPSPADALAALAASVPRGSRLLVAEYDPAAPGAVGPPIDRRIDPAEVEAWLTAAGFDHRRTASFPEESYGVLAQR